LDTSKKSQQPQVTARFLWFLSGVLVRLLGTLLIGLPGLLDIRKENQTFEISLDLSKESSSFKVDALLRFSSDVKVSCCPVLLLSL